METCRRGKHTGNGAGCRRIACDDGVTCHVAGNETVTDNEAIADYETIADNDTYTGGQTFASDDTVTGSES